MRRWTANKMRASVIVEPAHEGDIQEISALVNSAYRGEFPRTGCTTEADLLSGPRVDVAGLRTDLSLKPAAMALTMRPSAGGEILACVWLEQAGPDHFYLGMLAVRPALQSGGLGRALLEEAEGRSKAAGAWAMQLTVIAQRDALIAWYERRGYVQTGVIKPFPYGAPRVGEPRRLDLRLVEPREAFAPMKRVTIRAGACGRQRAIAPPVTSTQYPVGTPIDCGSPHGETRLVGRYAEQGADA